LLPGLEPAPDCRIDIEQRDADADDRIFDAEWRDRACNSRATMWRSPGRADSETWLRLLRKEASLPWALIRRRIRIKGALRLLAAFGRCFPS
jgi:hypothetical protein